MKGGVKYHPDLFKNRKTLKKQSYKNIKRGVPVATTVVEPAPTVTKKIVKTISLKPLLEELIFVDREPNDFLIKAMRLIRKMLKMANKHKKNVDEVVMTLVNDLYYALRKEDNINYNSNSTDSSYMSQSNIWNDPYSLLKILVRKLDLMLETDDHEFILEISETIKNAFKYSYNKLYNKPATEVDELSELFSGVRV